MSTTLFVGGRIHTPAASPTSALVVDGDHVAWLGDDEAAVGQWGDVDEVVQLDGALVTPAFVDAHVHTTSTGLSLTGLDLSSAASVEELLRQLEAHCRATSGGVIVGHGWDESSWPVQRAPTRQELDRASYGSVVYLSRIDVHSCVASSALLAITPEAKGQVGYDDSGWLKQQAHHTVRAAAFESITSRQRTAAQRVARSRAASLGIGMMHELGGPDISGRDDFAELITLARDESGPEVVGYWGEGGGTTQALSLGAHGAAGDLFVDGAIGSRTALLRQPYTDDPTTGAQYLSAAEIRDHVAACSVEGVQAGFHVIGDGAMDLVAAGFTEAVAKVGLESVRGARHRLEHVEMVDATHLRLFAELGLVLSVQPVFDELWGGDNGMYVGRLGSERANTLNPFAQMLDAGIVLAFGSDAPVTPLGPWAAVRAATQHQTREHGISVDAAFDAHTRGGWLAAGFDAGGVLTVGAPANIAIWSLADPVITTAGATTAGDRDRAASSRPHASTLPALEPDAPLPICLRTVVRGATVFLRD